MGARTYPTVKSSPVMNKQSSEKKEVRLGLMQIVILLGLTVGSIAAAFFLGFFVGRSVGFENELSSMTPSLPKLPVSSSDGSNEVGEQVVSEVYAKLNEKPTPGSAQATSPDGQAAKNDAMPELGSIQAADVNNSVANNAETVPTATTQEPAPVESTQNEVIDSNDALNIPLEEPNQLKKGDKDTKTLGAALADKEAHEQHADVRTIPEVKVETNALAEKTPKKEVAHVEVQVEKVKPTPPVTVTKTAATSSLIPQKDIPSGWFAQIAAPKQIDDARQLGDKLKKSGFAVVIEAAQVRGEDYFRVLVGPENSKSQADVLLKQLKRETYLKGEPFLRMVK